MKDVVSKKVSLNHAVGKKLSQCSQIEFVHQQIVTADHEFDSLIWIFPIFNKTKQSFKFII